MIRPENSIRKLHLRKLTFRRGGKNEHGFTLIELMIVIAIILILATIGIGHYQQTVVKAKETVLRQDLRDMRDAIQNYTLDKEAAPQSLQDLVDAHYLKEIPVDPVTGQRDWNAQDCDMELSPDQTSTGICDVQSSSDKVSPFDNTPYSSW